MKCPEWLGALPVHWPGPKAARSQALWRFVVGKRPGGQDVGGLRWEPWGASPAYAPSAKGVPKMDFLE